MNTPETLESLVERCQKVMSHAWMVRTFVKHSDEVEDYPELMGIVRTVFDTSRALETRTQEPIEYLKMLRKKLGKLRIAAAEFAEQAPLASAHTNFQQAVISMNTCVEELEAALTVATPLISVSCGTGESPINKIALPTAKAHEVDQSTGS